MPTVRHWRFSHKLPSESFEEFVTRPDQSIAVWPIDPANAEHIDLVADRMRATLVEVMGQSGEDLYSVPWLQDRVRWHLQPDACDGQVFLAHRGPNEIVGHVIVRVEAHSPDVPLGLISTIYVDPMFRRRGVARLLLDAGEAWLLSRQSGILATDTSAANVALIQLFESRGYAITFRSPEKLMVRLSRTA